MQLANVVLRSDWNKLVEEVSRETDVNNRDLFARIQFAVQEVFSHLQNIYSFPQAMDLKLPEPLPRLPASQPADDREDVMVAYADNIARMISAGEFLRDPIQNAHLIFMVRSLPEDLWYRYKILTKPYSDPLPETHLRYAHFLVTILSNLPPEEEFDFLAYHVHRDSAKIRFNPEDPEKVTRAFLSEALLFPQCIDPATCDLLAQRHLVDPETCDETRQRHLRENSHPVITINLLHLFETLRKDLIPNPKRLELLHRHIIQNLHNHTASATQLDSIMAYFERTHVDESEIITVANDHYRSNYVPKHPMIIEDIIMRMVGTGFLNKETICFYTITMQNFRATLCRWLRTTSRAEKNILTSPLVRMNQDVLIHEANESLRQFFYRTGSMKRLKIISIIHRAGTPDEKIVTLVKEILQEKKHDF